MMEIKVTVSVPELALLADAIKSLHIGHQTAVMPDTQPNDWTPSGGAMDDSIVDPSTGNTYETDPAVQAPVAPTAEPEAPQYTQEDLAHAAVALMGDPGKKQALVSLLAQFGVRALTELSADNYGAFATELRGLGADI